MPPSKAAVRVEARAGLQSASSLALVNAFRVVHYRNRLNFRLFSRSRAIYLDVFGEVIMSDKTGGPAFPYSALSPEGPHVYKDCEGMTLRDYFAAQIMCGMWANNSIQGSRDELAKGAYACADAIISERENEQRN